SSTASRSKGAQCGIRRELSKSSPVPPISILYCDRRPMSRRLHETTALFSNPQIQLQVCSPGRLGARRSALLAIGFYLGSDTLRRYTLGDLATSFAEHQYYPRGRRLVLYDAEGDFDRNFDWWKESGKHRLVEPHVPFENGRSDLLTGTGSRLDIQNINLLATLLVHAQYKGYWNQLGMQFQEEMEALLER